MENRMRLDRRHWLLGLKAAAIWVRNPVSEHGATQVAKIQYSLLGPSLLKEVEEMRAHPIGKRLLAERPAMDAAIDMDALAKLPEGSFGKTLHDVLDFPDTIPGYLLAGLAYKEGFFDSLDVTEEVRWYLDRRLQDHDASHVISGYMTDLAGEALNIYFILGHQTSLPKWALPLMPFGIFPLLQFPNIGWRKWVVHLFDAFDRGRAAQKHFPHHSVPYEELLPKPLEEVREFLGVTPLPEGWDTSTWFEGSKAADDVLAGRGENKDAKASDAKLSQAAVEAGIPWRDLMRASEVARNKVRAVAAQGGSLSEMQAALSA